MKAVPGRQGAASKIPQGMAHTHVGRWLWCLQAENSNNCSRRAGNPPELNWDPGEEHCNTRDTFSEGAFAVLPARLERSLKQDSEMQKLTPSLINCFLLVLCLTLVSDSTLAGRVNEKKKASRFFLNCKRLLQ